MEDRIFVFSKDTIKESKQKNYMMMAMTALIIIVFAFIFSSQTGDSDYKLMASIVAISITIAILGIIIISRIMFKNLIDMRLIVGINKFKRISYATIKFIQVIRGANGKIIMLKVLSENNRINIYGFEDMDTVLALMRNNVMDQSVITEKKYIVNWNSPVITILAMALTAGIFTFMIKTNLYYYRLFNMLFIFVFGLFLLLFKPISKGAGHAF